MFLFLAKFFCFSQRPKNNSFQEFRYVSIHPPVSKLPVAGYSHHSWFHHLFLVYAKSKDASSKLTQGDPL